MGAGMSDKQPAISEATVKRARELWEDAEIRRLASPWVSPTRFEGKERDHWIAAAQATGDARADNH